MSPQNQPFIVIEGIDGSGKSTLAANLTLSFQHDRAATLTREPYDPIPPGKERGRIREALMAPSDSKVDPVQLAVMFAANRFAHVDDVIKPLREQGVMVICDRYTLSTIAYQTLKLSEEFVFQLVRPAPRPDLTILLDMEPQAARDRLLTRGLPLESYERNLDTQVALRERYLDFVSRPQYYGDGDVIIVPADVTARLDPTSLTHYVRSCVEIWEKCPTAFPKPPQYKNATAEAMNDIFERTGSNVAIRRQVSDIQRVGAKLESDRRRKHAETVAAWAVSSTPLAQAIRAKG